MPLKTVTAAATRVQLTTTSTAAARVTLQRIATNTGKIYIGYAGMGLNSGALVSSTVYDCYLDASNPSVTFGEGETGHNTVDAQNIWLDADTNGEGVAFFLEQI